ncbi:MAG: hypothetical protein UX37_C0001G0006 [Microgenomates group bacterium GW2011_GWA2_46_16]|nr:MAG: hypothetical protein UX37_C0001G0006 [Microgenomates group bacterium GW2011_GWA2_46_16]
MGNVLEINVESGRDPQSTLPHSLKTIFVFKNLSNVHDKVGSADIGTWAAIDEFRVFGGSCQFFGKVFVFNHAVEDLSLA